MFTLELVSLYYLISLLCIAGLNIYQIRSLYRKKCANRAIIKNFLVFLIMQISVIFYAISINNKLLLIGYFISSCLSILVIFLANHYKKNIRLVDIINQIPSNIYWKDKSGVIMGCNEANMKNLNLDSITQVVGKKDIEIMPLEDAKSVCKIDKEIIISGQEKLIEEVVTINGEKRLYLSYKVPLRDKKGNIVGIIGNSVDITRRKKEASEKLNVLKDIISIVPGHVYWKDNKGNYLGCNNEQARSMGLSSPSEIVNVKPYRNVNKERLKALLEIDNKVLIDGETISVEEYGNNKKGAPVVFMTKKAPIYDCNNNIVGLVGVSVDITDKKYSEKMYKRLQRVVEIEIIKFLWAVLMGIQVAQSKLLAIKDIICQVEDKVLLDNFNESLSSLHNSKQAIERIPEKFQKIDYYTDLESNTLKVRPTSTKIRDLITAKFNSISSSLSIKNIDGDLIFSKNVPNFIEIDNEFLLSVLDNLLNNAVRFTFKGGVRLEVEYDTVDDENGVLKIIIEDTGVGIEEFHKSIMFDLFEGDSEDEDLLTEPGLQLSITRKIIEKMNGVIEVESEVNKGTKFLVHFPVMITTEQACSNVNYDYIFKATVESLEEKDKSYRFKEITILIVEDNFICLSMLSKQLSELYKNCTIIEAQTADRAFEIIENETPLDLIVTDINLQDPAGRSGLDILETVRDLPHLENVPRFAVTAHRTEEEEGLMVESGAMEILTKPVEMDYLGEIIDEYLFSEASS